MKSFFRFALTEHPIFSAFIGVALIASIERVVSGYPMPALLSFTFFCWGVVLLANIHFATKAEEAVEFWKKEAKKHAIMEEFYRRKLEGKR